MAHACGLQGLAESSASDTMLVCGLSSVESVVQTGEGESRVGTGGEERREELRLMERWRTDVQDFTSSKPETWGPHTHTKLPMPAKVKIRGRAPNAESASLLRVHTLVQAFGSCSNLCVRERESCPLCLFLGRKEVRR
jgi:hypothetical protein